MLVAENIHTHIPQFLLGKSLLRVSRVVSPETVILPSKTKDLLIINVNNPCRCLFVCRPIPRVHFELKAREIDGNLGSHLGKYDQYYAT